jgi:hypothetical protein
MPVASPQGVIAAIAASLKQPVVTITFAAVTVIAGYTVTATTVKSHTVAIEELRVKQQQLENDYLRREEFYRESAQIREDIRQVRDAQKETNKHLDDYIMRKDVRSQGH